MFHKFLFPTIATGALLLACLAGFRAQASNPVLYAGGIVDAARFSHELAPGMIVVVEGQNFSSKETSAPGLPLPTRLEGVSLEVSDRLRVEEAPLFSVGPDRILAQIPFGLSGPVLDLLVKTPAGSSGKTAISLLAHVPRVVPAANGATVFHADGRIVDEAAPARPGEALTLYAIGLGDVQPPIAAGAAAGDGAAGSPLHQVTVPVLVTIAGKEAKTLYAGLMPRSAGIYQINFEMPQDLITGPLEVAMQISGHRSQPQVIVPVSVTENGRDFFVSPAGTAEGDGSRENPWDMATALAHPPAVRSGDTIWLGEGVYGDGRTVFVSRLQGEPGKPVIVRQQRGERARIDGGVTVEGGYAWYWGFEVSSSVTDRTASGAAPHGFVVNGAETKLINLVIHDTGTGIGLWTPAENAEIYGCLIYANGYQDSDRGHGHGIYTQNLNGTKNLIDNVIFNQFAVGIHAYGSEKATVEGYRLEGNVVFNNGSIAAGNTLVDNILFAVGGSLGHIRLEDNYTYMPPAAGKGYSRLGWTFGEVENRNAVVRGNYWIGGGAAIELWRWNLLEYTGNTAYSADHLVTALALAPEQKTSSYLWDRNRYYGSGTFRFNGKNHNFNEWKTASELDRNSGAENGRPTGVWTFVRPNRYEPGRSHVVIYNWDLRREVAVDVSGVLKPGARFEIRDTQNYFGEPLVSGVWNGGPVTIPMTELHAAPATGNVPVPPVHTAPEFGAFVVVSY